MEGRDSEARFTRRIPLICGLIAIQHRWCIRDLPAGARPAPLPQIRLPILMMPSNMTLSVPESLVFEQSSFSRECVILYVEVIGVVVAHKSTVVKMQSNHYSSSPRAQYSNSHSSINTNVVRQNVELKTSGCTPFVLPQLRASAVFP